MKFTEPWERQKLSFLLERAVSREAMMWKVYVPKKPSSQVTEDTDVSPAQRAEAVRWLTELHGKLLLYPETLVLAVSILDRFLAPIRARPKYLRCIAIACYFLAAKTCEEDECVPSLGDLAGTSRCDCSPSEVRRMERIILDKLDWDLHTATPLDFLHIFHAMILSCRSGFLESRGGGNRSHHLALLTQRLYTCLEKHSLTQQRGSMLALALLSLELESCCPDWLVLTIDLLRKAQMDSSDLIRCRELVSQLLSTQTASLPPNTVYIYHLGTRPGNQDTTTAPLPPPRPLNHHRHLLAAPPRCKASAKRKVEAMEVDDFYDGIKRLYNEDLEGAAAPPTPGGRGGGGGGGERAEARVSRSVPSSRQEGSTSPCPPLQPICAP